MKKSTRTILIVAGILVILAIILVTTYNGLVTGREGVDSAFSKIDTQLQRRADLIPNLVNTVKGYAAHEQAAIDSVTEARARLAGAQTVEEKSAANTELTSALNRLLVVVENYPDLKASQNFIALQDQLEGTENRIAVARTDYNDTVRAYNTRLRTFPTSIFAGMFGFSPADYFEADESGREVPEVTF